jgi:hypothetical protein
LQATSNRLPGLKWTRGPAWVLAIAAAMWLAALGYAAVAGRVLYADGAWYVLVHLFTPHRFNDYDFQRSFASFISQAPVLFAQRFGADNVSTYAALYAFGIFGIPALMMLAALFLARRQPALFAANAAAIAIWGFGTNFINTEANLLFGAVWLAGTILALDGPAPVLRGFVLPVLGLAMLRMYEGMLLAGPVLALFAAISARRAAAEQERIGLTLAAFLFFGGAVVGLGGFLSPRDPSNAAGFLASVPAYLRGPQALLMVCALAAFAAAVSRGAPRLRIAGAVASAGFGIAYLAAIGRLEGYSAYAIYYHNRSFLVVSLPLFVGALLLAREFRPRWFEPGPPVGYGWCLVPLAFAVAADLIGTMRWNRYVGEFCAILEAPLSPAERLARLKSAPVQTGWAWINPATSVLLRERGSNAIVLNDPGNFEPFDARKPVHIKERGFCQAPLVGKPLGTVPSQELSFTGAGPGPELAGASGLSRPEGWATWSEGPLVTMRFARPLPADFDLRVRIAAAYGANRGAPIKVVVGGKEQTFIVDKEPFETTLRFAGTGGENAVTFAIPHPQSPTEAGRGDDPRKLGVAFLSLSVLPRAKP